MDIIMAFGVAVFGILFAFLFIVFVLVIISMFKKEKRGKFEPGISIVIPCYNEEKRLKGTLDSIFASDYPKRKMEIIVADDGSTDRSVKIAMAYKKLPITALQGKHKGKSETLNNACKRCKYEFILTLDADTTIEKDFLKRIVWPFKDPRVGATNGSCMAAGNDGILTMFQTIEYHYNNLIRKSFTEVFGNAIWFFGAFACYRKKVLEEIGYFKKTSLTEDMESMLGIYEKGYRIVNVYDALCSTRVPTTFKDFAKQRMRWWAGSLQSLIYHRNLFSANSNPSVLFLFINQFWWSFYAIISMPLIGYQFAYWLPAGAYEIAGYTLRWFTLSGPIYWVYKIPEWGISIYGVFGVLSGLVSAALIILSLYTFKDRLNFRNSVAIFLYFPYTIVLNTVVVASLIKLTFLRKRYFIS